MVVEVIDCVQDYEKLMESLFDFDHSQTLTEISDVHGFMQW